jgi:hypothetical protein
MDNLMWNFSHKGKEEDLLFNEVINSSRAANAVSWFVFFDFLTEGVTGKSIQENVEDFFDEYDW